MHKKSPLIVGLHYFIHFRYHFLKIDAPKTSVNTASATKTKKRTFAMEAAPAAIPPNPKMAAIIAITKKITA